MKSSMFDDLTKALATAPSRRQALKTIVATALGSLLGLGGVGTALADCKPAGHQCSKDEHCCSGVCCDRVCCDTGQGCQNGACVTCTSNGGSCTQDSDCCAGVCDLYTETCGCQPSGVRCERDVECCSGTCNLEPSGTGFCA